MLLFDAKTSIHLVTFLGIGRGEIEEYQMECNII